MKLYEFRLFSFNMMLFSNGLFITIQYVKLRRKNFTLSFYEFSFKFTFLLYSNCTILKKKRKTIIHFLHLFQGFLVVDTKKIENL